ncbi:hypothetical protein [Nonomuraea sp. NPDC050310]|uniref:hypothetical protein n=1 Tax=unclassified Nonomuraea TaxID=2593643 RepID=UPI0033C8BB30
MLKELCAAGALVAAALAPATGSQASASAAKDQAVSTPAASISLAAACTSSLAPRCKWLKDKKKECLYCKTNKGGYRKQYCKKAEHSKVRECKYVKEPTPASPNRYCIVCVHPTTGKQLSKECYS